MGGGGLLQLVAYGAQDVFLTGSPQITYFKQLYRRHTNFSQESIEQSFIGSATYGGRPSVTISRNGDLLSKVYLEVELQPNTGALIDTRYVSKLGHKLIKYVECEIGGQKIDRVFGRWMDTWYGWTHKAEKDAGYAEMTLVDHDMNPDQGYYLAEKKKIWIPISFWFTKSAGAALPLISLQYHEVKLIFDIEPIGEILKTVDSTAAAAGISGSGSQFATVASTSSSAGLSTLVTDGPPSNASQTAYDPKFKLWADFIFLDTPERRRFAQSSHEYLIEQLQTTGEDPKSKQRSHNIRLSFNHPCKLFAWQFIPKTFAAENALLTGTGPNESYIFDPFYNGVSVAKTKQTVDKSCANPIASVKLQLNGHERFAERPGAYFSLVQPYQHLDAIPTKSYQGCYSFCLAPSEHQPSGALNCSRVDNASITFEMTEGAGNGENMDGKFIIYAVNYNVLRVLSGMGGLAFSN